MTRDDVRAFFGVWHPAWERRDPVALAAGYAEAGSLTSPMFARVTGRPAITASFRTLFEAFPDWTMSFDDPLVDGDRVALPFVTTATHRGEFMGIPGSGRTFEINGVLLLRFEDHLIVEERRVYDFTGLLMKIGVLRGKPAR